MRISTLAFVAPLAVLAACGGSPAGDPRYPAQKPGCEVKLFHGPPTMPTDNIGSVTARCGDDVSDADCIRQLLDETCKLGGDVVWGVDDKPTMEVGKNVWRGRAAHTKAAVPAK